MEYRRYTDREGIDRWVAEVIASEVKILGTVSRDSAVSDAPIPVWHDEEAA
jgi:single-stranded DNA-binding protein